MVTSYVIKLDSIKAFLAGADGGIVRDQVRLDQKLFSHTLMVALYVIKLDSIISSSHKRWW